MKPRNLIITLLLTVCGFTTASAQSLVLRHRDGTASVVRVTDSLRLQTAGPQISVISGADTQTYDNDDILSITYRKGRSDVNRDYKTDISDVVAIINDIAGGGKDQQAPSTSDADVNGDGKTDISDVVAVINVMAGQDNTPLPVVPAEDTDYYSETGNAFYIYRNDGEFNGFLRNDADSISFKKGCQLVHTQDSTYAIPFAAIDSVSFIIQKPVLREGLFFLNDYHASHTAAIDSLTLYFDTAVIPDSLPAVGQVVVHGVYTHPYEEGFAGRVKSITRENDLIKIDCDMICIGDVFKHLVLVGDAESVSEEEYAKNRRSNASSDPWFKYEAFGKTTPLYTLPNMKFSFPGDIYSIESIAPKLKVSYTVYVDEWTYRLSATCRLYHDEFVNKYTYKIGDLVKLADEGNLDKKDEELLDIMIRQHNYENLSDEDWVNSVLWENKHKGSKEKRSKDDADFLKKLWDKMHWSYSVPVYGPIVLDLEVGPVPLLKGGLDVSYSETSKARNTFYVETWGNTMVTMADPRLAIATGAAHIKGSTDFQKDEPYKQSLKIKGKGSLNLGIQGSAGFSLLHKSLVHANVHFQAGVRFVGELGMEISNENASDWGWYEAFKDTRIKFEPFFSHGVELGISPWSFLTASFDWEHDLGEFGSVYLFPHFTRPALSEYDTKLERLDYVGLDPLVLQSQPSKNVISDGISFMACKIGLRIVDEDGNTVRETEEIKYHGDKDEFWKEFQPTISLKGLQAGKKYRCYPVLRYFMKDMWRATPSFEFTVPEKISVSETSVNLNVGETKEITLNGGWGVYKIINDDIPEIVSAKFENQNSGEKVFVNGKDENGVNFPVENLRISLTGQSAGTTTIYLEDMHSEDRLMVKVEVGEGDNNTNERFNIYSYDVDGVNYSLYKKNIKNDSRTNPDGALFYKSVLMLDISKNGNTQTYDICDDLYLYDGADNGQTQCIAINNNTKKIYIFSNSKTDGLNYDMDGFVFISPLDNINFKKITIFREENWGWFPYFTSSYGTLSLQHFNFDGYYAMTSTRSDDENWSTNKGIYVRPENFARKWTEKGSMFVFGNNERYPILSCIIDGVTYALFKKNDKSETQVNSDGWEFYKSALTLDITKNGKTQTFIVSDDLYLCDGESNSQTQCMAIDFNAWKIYIFSNSKTRNIDYKEDGYVFVSFLDNISFIEEPVFNNYNWGWFPYFTYSSGALSLQHFSFLNYFAVTSTRIGNEGWKNEKGMGIQPGAFESRWMEHGSVLVIGN